jgi:hypothetical protein
MYIVGIALTRTVLQVRMFKNKIKPNARTRIPSESSHGQEPKGEKKGKRLFLCPDNDK